MVNTFFHHRGGDSSYTFALTDQLQARGHTVIPFAMQHPRNLPSPYASNFSASLDYPALASQSRWQAGRMALTRGIWNLEAADRLDRLLDRVRPDVAHLQHLHHHLTPSVLVPLERRGIPVVWTLHDYELLCPTGHFFRDGKVCEDCRVFRFDQAIRHRCERNSRAASLVVAFEKALHRLMGVLERVQCFIAPSAFLRDKLLEYGVSASRVTHLPNFLDPQGAPTRPPADGGILVACRLTAEKGVRVAIDAARAGLPAPLLVAGEGPDRAALEAYAGPLKNAGRVRFLGAVPHEAMQDLQRQARIVLVPSIWYENFPFAVLEAFAAARPVVASRIGGIPEQIDDGLTGRLVPPGNGPALHACLLELIEDPEAAHRLGLAGHARLLERFGSGGHLDRLEALYTEVMSATSR